MTVWLPDILHVPFPIQLLLLTLVKSVYLNACMDLDDMNMHAYVLLRHDNSYGNTMITTGRGFAHVSKIF